MKLNGVNLYICRTPFVLVFESRHLARSAAESVVIELLFEQGPSGWGESAPRVYVTGETAETVCRLIQEVFTPILFKAEITSAWDVEALLDRMEADCMRKAIPSYLSALGACDLALLDALAKKNEVQVTTFFGPPLRNNISRALSVPFLPIEKLADFVQPVRTLKIMNIKVLMQSDPVENHRRVQWVREQLDPSVRIWVEANGHWTLEESIFQLRHLKDMGICGVEQPVPAGDLMALRTIREETGLPVIVDESLCSYSQAQALIEAKACDIMNIKISKCGGLLRSRSIADLAQAHGIGCQLGSHVGETAILSAAGDCFARTAPGLLHYENGSSLLFGGVLNTGQLGSFAPDRYGLGVAVNSNELTQISALRAPSRRGVRSPESRVQS